MLSRDSNILREIAATAETASGPEQWRDAEDLHVQALRALVRALQLGFGVEPHRLYAEVKPRLQQGAPEARLDRVFSRQNQAGVNYVIIETVGRFHKWLALHYELVLTTFRAPFYVARENSP